jgi:hypothetical protein
MNLKNNPYIVRKKKSKNLIPTSRQNFTRKKIENPQNNKIFIKKTQTSKEQN